MQLCVGLPESLSSFADEGTAAHALAARALTYGKPAAFFEGEQVRIGEKNWTFTEEMCGYVQIYLDYIAFLAHPGYTVFTELPIQVNELTTGTADAVLYAPGGGNAIVVDLKYGKGVPVDAQGNEQEGIYALGVIDTIASLFGDKIDNVTLVIVQPRLDAISEWNASREWLEKLRLRAQRAKIAATAVQPDLHPSEGACRWCPAKANCPALSATVEAELATEFGDATPFVAGATLADRWAALPLIRQYIDATEKAAFEAVSAGQTLVGPDALPLKLVRGNGGHRRWDNPELVATILSGQLGPAAYSEPQVITPAVADKLINKGSKKKTVIWEQIIAPRIVKPLGAPILVLGSDPREAYTSALAQEFESCGM